LKRVIYVVITVLVLAALTWFVSPLWHGSASYAVVPGADGKMALVLRVERPGLFVDLVPAPDGPHAESGFAPWPGSGRRRIATWFRGPMELSLTEGEGPFALRDLPVPVGGAAPEVQLPQGWSQAGPYVGPFGLTGGLWAPSVAAAKAEVSAKLGTLLTAAELQFNRALVREYPPVLMGADPMSLATAVTERWVPDYGPELRWLETGLTQYLAVELLDNTKVWSATERNRWLRDHRADKGYAIVTWLDANLKLNRQKLTLQDLLLKTQDVRSTADLTKVVNEMAGLSAADHLERMLKGAEPLPVTK
jgi:hypothetical protein